MGSLSFEDDSLVELDSELVGKYPEYGNLVTRVNTDQLELSNWDKLFTYLDQLIELDKSDSLKNVIHNHYMSLLLKLPYLIDYWKYFIALEYQLQGLNRSVKEMQRSLELFPNSLDLWIDYLNVIISNNLHNGNDEFIRTTFKRGLEMCGRQFLSHPLWDQYLEWELKQNGENSAEYLAILLQVIELPLHQYAKYSTKFLELKDNFPLNELISEGVLTNLLNERLIDSVSVDEQRQISDQYFGDIIAKTSQLTNERWNYEQNIQITQFQLQPIPGDELINWEKYLEFEESQGIKEQIVSLYERCLIVCSMYEKFWVMYLKYLIRSKEDDQQIKQIFNKGLRLVPKEFPYLRMLYARYLLDQDVEKSFDILEQLLNGDLLVETKVLQNLLVILKKDESFTQDSDSFLQYAFGDYEIEDDHVSKKRKSNNDRSIIIKDISEVKQKLNETIIGDKFKRVIYKLSNYQNLISIILNDKLSQIKDIKIKRDFYLKYIGKSIISRDLKFWQSFVSFEILQRNTKNISNILNYLLNYSQLPHIIQNDLIKRILKFLYKNINFSKTALEINKILLEIDENSSFNYKKFSKLKNLITDSNLLRQLGHPGIDTEVKPMIVNRINFFEVQDLKSPHSLPIYKNVEKLNAAIKYPVLEDLV